MKIYPVIVANFYVTNMFFNAIRENKILEKISKFTVLNKITSNESNMKVAKTQGTLFSSPICKVPVELL